MSEVAFYRACTILTGALVGALTGAVGRLALLLWPELSVALAAAVLAPVWLGSKIAWTVWPAGRRR